MLEETLTKRETKKKKRKKRKEMRSLFSDQFTRLDVALDYRAGPGLTRRTNTASLKSATDAEYDSGVSDVRLPVSLDLWPS